MLLLYMISELIHRYIYSHVIYHFEERFSLYRIVLFVTVLNLFIHFFAGFSTAWTKFKSARFFLFQFKLGRKTAETARDINDAFGPGTTNERVAQRWFKKFRNGDESLEYEDGHSRPTTVDNEHLKAIIEADPRKTTREVAVEIEVDHSTVVSHLK